MESKKPLAIYIILLVLFISSSACPLIASGIQNYIPQSNKSASLHLIATVRRSDEIERHMTNILQHYNSYPDGYNVDSSPYLTINKIKVEAYQNQSALFTACKPNEKVKMLIIITQ